MPKVNYDDTIAQLIDPSNGSGRLSLLLNLINSGADGQKVVLAVLERARDGYASEDAIDKRDKIDAQIKQLKQGALVPGTFAGKFEANRVRVIDEHGHSIFPCVLDADLMKKLEPGDDVLLSNDGSVLLHSFGDEFLYSEEAVFERRINDSFIEVSRKDGDKKVVMMTTEVKLALDECKNLPDPGSVVLIHPTKNVACKIIPPKEGPSKYMYLDHGPVPDVIVERDLGDPHPFIEELSHHLDRELNKPNVGRKYRIRRTVMRLLEGVSGSGKTYSIDAFIRRTYEIMAKYTGAKLEQLPPRVLRMTSESVLSMWFGQSDKQLSRFFDEVILLHDEPFKHDGKEWNLPVIAIGEEIEALARTRGGDADGIYDRIQSVALRRMDSTRPEFQNRLIVFLFTSNVPGLIDPAFLRRAGGQTAHFGRLAKPESFHVVLEKLMREMPVKGGERAKNKMIEQITVWLFPKADAPGSALCKLTYAGSDEKHPCFYRDFLTCATVDRAVQQSAHVACRLEELDKSDDGITIDLLTDALKEQIASIVRQLSGQNIHNYMDIPRDLRVTQISLPPKQVKAQ